MASEAESSKTEAVNDPPRVTDTPRVKEFGPQTAEEIVLGILKEPNTGREEGLMVEVTASDGQQAATSGQYSPVVSNMLKSPHLQIPEQHGRIPMVTVRDSYGTRLLSSSEVLAVQSATTGLAPASPSSTTTATTQILTKSTPQGMPMTQPAVEEPNKARKGSKKKSKKEKHRDKLPTLASMIGRRTSPGKSAKSPKKKRHSLPIACASSMSTSHVLQEEGEGMQNSKKRRLSEVALSSDEEGSAGTNPQGVGQTKIETKSETQSRRPFQDHHTLQDEVFRVDNDMTAADMLRAGFTMLKQGQQLFHSINSAMSQQTKALETMEEKQAQSLVAIEANNKETKDAIQSLARRVGEQAEAVEFAHERIGDMEKDLEAFRTNVFGGVEGVIENHNKLVRTVTHRDDLIKEMKTKIAALEKKAGHTEMVLKEGGLVRKDFHPDYTIVVENLPYMKSEGEDETDDDLHQDASYIFRKCMRVDVEVIRVKRMSVRRNGTGLVKFELASREMVREVLKNKSRLREPDNHPEIQRLWVRQSKTTERLVEEHNTDVLLQELNLTSKYKHMPNGRLVVNRRRQSYYPRERQSSQDRRYDHRRDRVHSRSEDRTRQHRDSYGRRGDAVTDRRYEGYTTQNRDNRSRRNDPLTNRRQERYDPPHRPRDSYAGTARGRRYATDGSHNRDRRIEPEQPFHLRTDQTRRESVVFDREAHRRRVGNQGPEDIRKKWEQAWTNHAIAASVQENQGTKRLAGPPHPPRDGRTEQNDGSRWRSTVSFRSPVECRLDDHLLDVRRMKAETERARNE